MLVGSSRGGVCGLDSAGLVPVYDRGLEVTQDKCTSKLGCTRKGVFQIL